MSSNESDGRKRHVQCRRILKQSRLGASRQRQRLDDSFYVVSCNDSSRAKRVLHQRNIPRSDANAGGIVDVNAGRATFLN
jgi:hypothetical protein